MKKILAVIGGIVVSAFTWAIVKGIGEWFIDVLKGTDGMVTASEIISLRYVLPVVVALLAGFFSAALIEDK